MEKMEFFLPDPLHYPYGWRSQGDSLEALPADVVQQLQDAFKKNLPPALRLIRSPEKAPPSAPGFDRWTGFQSGVRRISPHPPGSKGFPENNDSLLALLNVPESLWPMVNLLFCHLEDPLEFSKMMTSFSYIDYFPGELIDWLREQTFVPEQKLASPDAAKSSEPWRVVAFTNMSASFPYDYVYQCERTDGSATTSLGLRQILSCLKKTVGVL